MTPAQTLAKEQAAARRSHLEESVAIQLRAWKLMDGMEKEFQFLGDRQFRFDFCWPAEKLALEVDGGTWSGGRHTRGAGFQKDCEKFALAAIEGWRVIRVTADQVNEGWAARWTARARGRAT